MVQWKPSSSPVPDVLGQQEALRVEPRLTLPLAQVVEGGGPLLGVVREGGRVHGQPGLLVAAHHERPQHHALGCVVGPGVAGGVVRSERTPHLPELALAGRPAADGEGGRTRVVAVGPRQHPAAGPAARTTTSTSAVPTPRSRWLGCTAPSTSTLGPRRASSWA